MSRLSQATVNWERSKLTCFKCGKRRDIKLDMTVFGNYYQFCSKECKKLFIAQEFPFDLRKDQQIANPESVSINNESEVSSNNNEG